MANFAVMSGDVVSNVIVADAVENAELATGLTCVEYTELNTAGIGWSYDATTGKFIAPVVAVLP